MVCREWVYVYALYVEKCVGDLSLRIINCVLSMSLCIIFPRGFFLGGPQDGCQPLKSPVSSEGVCLVISVFWSD